MKKILVFSVIFFLFNAIPAIAKDVNLAGCWEVEIEGITSQGQPTDENNNIWIVQEGNNLFWGWVCNFDNEDPPNPIPAEEGMHFSGAKDGKNIYFTHWDSFTKVTLNGKGDKFYGINQAVSMDNREGRTSFGNAFKVDDGDCSPCLPYSEPE